MKILNQIPVSVYKVINPFLTYFTRGLPNPASQRHASS